MRPVRTTMCVAPCSFARPSRYFTSRDATPRRRDSEARESHQSTASLRHDNRFEALHLTESPGNRPFDDRLAKVGAVECLEQRDEGRGVFAAHEANSEAGRPRLDGHAFTPPLSRNAGP